MVMYSLLVAVFGVVTAVAISGAGGEAVAEGVIPVSGVVDGVGGFDELDGAWDVTTAKIEGRTYAVVASMVDDGLQIVDITNPWVPVPVASVTDGVGGFNELDGASGIDIAQMKGRTYAVVASVLDDGVQIVEITHPWAPVPVASLTDGIGGFDMLDGARNVAIAYVEDGTYAVVLSPLDNGVQIVDMTDPWAPVPVAGISDGTDGFTQLRGVKDIRMVEIEGRTYALVASSLDSGMQIIDITDPENPLPAGSVTDGIGGFDVLGGAAGICLAESDGRTYAVVSGYHDDGVQIVDITDPENPLPAGSITDGIDGFDVLDGAKGVAGAQVRGHAYVVVASTLDDGIQVIDLTLPWAPGLVAGVTDGVGGSDVLDGAKDVTIVEIDGQAYAVVASTVDDGIQIVDISRQQ